MSPEKIAKNFTTYITTFAIAILMIKTFFFIEAYGSYVLSDQTKWYQSTGVILCILSVVVLYIAIFLYMDKFFNEHYTKTRLAVEDIRRLKIIGILVAIIPIPDTALEHLHKHIEHLGNHDIPDHISFLLEFDYITFAIGLFIYTSAAVARR